MKKNEKRLCSNCEGEVSLHLTQCPYCGHDLSLPVAPELKEPYHGLGSPFQQAPSTAAPPPPYAKEKILVSEEEWKQALDHNPTPAKEERENSHKKELVALFLLLPGVVFCLFGLLLLLFSDEGVLTLRWNQNFAYFYFLGAVPLIFFGWQAIKK